MPDFVQLLNFEKATSILGVTPADVRVLFVEERTLPALYGTQVGYKEPFQYQRLRVDDIGRAPQLPRTRRPGRAAGDG